jgi:ATP-dependent DNA helicase DinG
MAKTYVALDLETTGLDSEKDAIIEIGAVRFQGEHILETFSTFVNPGRRIPDFVVDLTGITDNHVKGAPGIREAARDVVDFVGRDLIVGHSVQFDLAFLQRHGAFYGHPAVDTFELAGILVPHASRYSLENLVTELGIVVPGLPEQTHRALDDARMTYRLFVALMKRAAELPSETRAEIIRLGRQVNWGPANFFRDANYFRREQGIQGAIGAQLAARSEGKVGILAFEEEEPPPPLTPRETIELLDVEALTRLLDEEGAVAQSFPEYEYREQQVNMLQAVAQAFNDGAHLMVEAGTGTGKSLAYLLPALHWAVQNEQRVVISTNTINLQEQLVSKDLPAMADVLPFDFRYQILKGRSHYLCLRSFTALRQRGPRNHHEMRVLAKVLCWLPNTVDGDGDALFFPTREERGIWHSISAADESCAPLADEEEFFYRARAKAEGAHVLVINHALLLADIVTNHHVLPEYDLLIVDEAHHLERAATESLREEASWPGLRYALEDLQRQRGKSPGVFYQIRQIANTMPHKARVPLERAIVHLEDGADYVMRRLEEVFDTAEIFADDNITQHNPHYSARLRLTEELRIQPSWRDVELAWARAAEPLSTVAEGLQQLAEGIGDLMQLHPPEAEMLEGLQFQAAGIARRLAAAHGQLHAMIAEPKENAICWIEKPRHQMPIILNAVPLDVGPMLQEHVFKKNRSVILTSATLRAGGDFDYMRERLGADNSRELTVGSPFDYPNVALLYLVTDIPDPGKRGYQQAVNSTLLRLFRATEGRGMALFTSYNQLRRASKALTGKLAQEGITVFAQGEGGSRAQLLENFQQHEKAVLLGTRSFWEGVDIPGESLSCLVITKLPFDVPNDPIVEARAGRYENPFMEYMVPEATLRFMQGFGRLIRKASDQGIAVVMDHRLLSRRYGQRFLDSLPDPQIRKGSREELPIVAQRWLAGQSVASEPVTDEFEDLWYVPPPDEPPWWGA